MSTYAYKCNDCDTKYEVFHRTKEIESDVKCPSCASGNSKKIMSASFNGFSTGRLYDSPPVSSCSSGMCGLN